MGASGAGVGQILGAAGTFYGGYRANSEARKQAGNQIADSEYEAALMEEDNKKLISEQESAYAKLGVILEGSPLLVIEETRQKGLRDRMRVREVGRSRAEAIAAEGRNKFIGAMFQGTSQLMGGMGGMGGGGGTYGGGGARTYSKSYAGGNSRLTTAMD